MLLPTESSCQILSSLFNGGKLVQLFKPQMGFWTRANINMWISTKLFFSATFICNRLHTFVWAWMWPLKNHDIHVGVKGQLMTVNSLPPTSGTQIWRSSYPTEPSHWSRSLTVLLICKKEIWLGPLNGIREGKTGRQFKWCEQWSEREKQWINLELV